MKYWDKALTLTSGCTKISPACLHCWAETNHNRFMRRANKKYDHDFSEVRVHDNFEVCYKNKKGKVFAIWNDLFHESIGIEFIQEAFNHMGYLKHHTFLVCTKRPHRIEEVLYGSEGDFYMGGGDYLPNVFLGTTVESQDFVYRASDLTTIHAPNLFLSVEPMLSAITIPQDILKEYAYIITGCESGTQARETKEEWVRDLRNQCLEAGVPLWVKQLRVNGKMCYNHSLSTINVEDLWK